MGVAVGGATLGAVASLGTWLIAISSLIITINDDWSEVWSEYGGRIWGGRGFLGCCVCTVKWSDWIAWANSDDITYFIR